MAKAKVNKSQAIRDALKSHKGKTPAQIAEILNLEGVKVTGTYVSNIKHNSRKARKRRTLTVRGTARRTTPMAAPTASFSSLHSALEFIRAAGGIENARSAMQTLELVREALG